MEVDELVRRSVAFLPLAIATRVAERNSNEIGGLPGIRVDALLIEAAIGDGESAIVTGGVGVSIERSGPHGDGGAVEVAGVVKASGFNELRVVGILLRRGQHDAADGFESGVLSRSECLSI